MWINLQNRPTPRKISLLLSHYHPLTIDRVLLMITPYHFISFPFCRLRENHGVLSQLNFSLPTLPTRICKWPKHNRYQRNFSEVRMLPHPPLHDVNGVNNEILTAFCCGRLVCRHIVSIWRKCWHLKATFSGTRISLTWSSFSNILTPIVLRPTNFALKCHYLLCGCANFAWYSAQEEHEM